MQFFLTKIPKEAPQMGDYTIYGKIFAKFINAPCNRGDFVVSLSIES